MRMHARSCMFFLLKEILSVTAVLCGIIFAIGPDTEST